MAIVGFRIARLEDLPERRDAVLAKENIQIAVTVDIAAGECHWVHQPGIGRPNQFARLLERAPPAQQRRVLVELGHRRPRGRRERARVRRPPVLQPPREGLLGGRDLVLALLQELWRVLSVGPSSDVQRQMKEEGTQSRRQTVDVRFVSL